MPNSQTDKKTLAIMVLSSPHASAHAQTALAYCQSVLDAGHQIYRIFFYHEAAYLGNTANCAPQDEINLSDRWQQLIQKYDIDSVVCIASGLKRGMLDTTEAKRYEKTTASLSPCTELSGLGQWIDAVNQTDQHIIFGN
ncbi:MAG: sulfurtransferase complex subunit TusD [Pseudomonadales bacterium]|nr:sulfurtransferase complex subunit TusD [Pseudomonadales bacterium]